MADKVAAVSIRGRNVSSRKDLERLSTKTLVALYNKHSSASSKVESFASREAALGRCWSIVAAYLDWEAAREPDPTAGRRPEFRFAPVEKPRDPLPETKRARLLALASRPEGALLSELAESHGGGRRAVLTAVRNLHHMTGFGLWSEPAADGDVQVWVVDQQQYERYKRAAEGRPARS